jgi:hypothetical protein
MKVSASVQFCTDYCDSTRAWRRHQVKLMDGDSIAVEAVTDDFGRAAFANVPQGSYMLVTRCRWHGPLWYGPYWVGSNETQVVKVFHRCTGQFRWGECRRFGGEERGDAVRQRMGRSLVRRLIRLVRFVPAIVLLSVGLYLEYTFFMRVLGRGDGLLVLDWMGIPFIAAGIYSARRAAGMEHNPVIDPPRREEP